MHYWSLPESEIELRLGHVGAAIKQRLAEIDAHRAKLQGELDREQQLTSRLSGGLHVDWASLLARSNPKIDQLAKELLELIDDAETKFFTEQLPEADDLQLRLAKATHAIAERR